MPHQGKGLCAPRFTEKHPLGTCLPRRCFPLLTQGGPAACVQTANRGSRAPALPRHLSRVLAKPGDSRACLFPLPALSRIPESQRIQFLKQTCWKSKFLLENVCHLFSWFCSGKRQGKWQALHHGKLRLALWNAACAACPHSVSKCTRQPSEWGSVSPQYPGCSTFSREEGSPAMTQLSKLSRVKDGHLWVLSLQPLLSSTS